MSLRLLAPLALATLLLPAPGCSGGEAHAGDDGLTGRLTLSGSSTMAPLVSEAARRFEKLHPGLRIDVQTGGSSRGIADAGSGLADIGMSSRALTHEEADGLESFVVARDGVAFLVNSANPVNGIDAKQALAIFTGKIHDWSELGGASAPITVVNRADGRSEVSLVSEFLGIAPSAMTADAIAGENEQGIKQVAGDPDAITYMSVGTSEYEAAHGTPVKLLALDGVPASSETVASGTYPLARPLVVITKPKAGGSIRAFVDYLTSPAVDDLIHDHSFVPPRR